MRGQEYHTEGTEWPWRIFTLVFNNRLFGDIVGTQFLKICSALRVAQTGKKKKKGKKGEPEQQIYKTATWYRCEMWTDSRTYHADYSQREKESSMSLYRALLLSQQQHCAIQSLMFKQN